ncbi:MBL fold metallo-hydrolase [Roseibium aquae]|uniref:MBL fold metallo-hydrolase n=1 Tax=Roseibium aquae TaxID=1323746 RepID=A0A916TM43_9HYPH|nr:MBL fold metallo-hydrolase [Roseibium aquae]GGB56773.1 MBL fold metallo-hydrolase [Roseibium aquae]
MGNTNRFQLTRRQMLASGLALGASAGLGWPASPVRAQATWQLGPHELTVLSDGNLTLPMSFFLPDRSAEEIESLFAPHGMALDALTPDCNITLLRSGERLVLFDVGAGPNFQPTAGALPSALDDLGIDPADITDVVLTHAHPDHLWGILDDFEDPLYPEAQVWVPQAEWDYWRADDTLDKTPEARKSFVVGAQSRFDAIEDRVSMVTPGQEVLPGIEALDTSGHTPGHMSYMVHGGSDSVLILGDAITNAVVSFERPDWASGSDQDPEKGIETRTRLLDRLAADQSLVIGFHLPEPGRGRVERAGSAYRFAAS